MEIIGHILSKSVFLCFSMATRDRLLVAVCFSCRVRHFRISSIFLEAEEKVFLDVDSKAKACSCTVHSAKERLISALGSEVETSKNEQIC